MNLLAGESLGTDFGVHNITTVINLLQAAFADPNFATVLYNHRSKAHSILDELRLSYQKSDPKNLPELADFDKKYEEQFGVNTHLAQLALQSMPEKFDEHFESIIAENEWMNVEIFSNVYETILSIAHLENLILKVQQNAETATDLAALSTDSIIEITREAMILLILSNNSTRENRDRAKAFNYDPVKSLNKAGFAQNVAENLSSIGHRIARVSNPHLFGLYLGLSDLLNSISVSFLQLKGTTKKYKLELCVEDHQQFRVGYKHLNEREELCELDLPVVAFQGLPIREDNDSGYRSQSFITKIELPENVDMEKVERAFSFTFDEGCTCDYDCHCPNESYSLNPLKGGYVAIERSVTYNI